MQYISLIADEELNGILSTPSYKEVTNFLKTSPNSYNFLCITIKMSYK